MKHFPICFHKRLLVTLCLTVLLVITCIYRHTVIISTSYYYNTLVPNISTSVLQQQHHAMFSPLFQYKNSDRASRELLLQLLQPSETEKVQDHLYRHLDNPYDFDTYIPDDTWEGLSTRGVIYMLVRNEDVSKIRLTMREFQDRMRAAAPAPAAWNNESSLNSYPWVFLNVQKFTPEFKKYVSKMIPDDGFSNKRKIFFGQIDLEAWNYPEWIDSKRTEEEIIKQIVIQQNSKHVDSLTKKQKMRYQAGLFFHHPLFNNVDYVLRLEPGASFPCDIAADPFETMEKENKKLGFTITTRDDLSSGLSLWPATEEFMKSSLFNTSSVVLVNQTIRSWLFNVDDGQVQFNFCHLSTAFEMIDLSFLKSNGYNNFFQYLDLVGGFFYERWSDGAVRTIAASLFLKEDDIHFFNDIGHSYGNIQHCPFNSNSMDQCLCDMKRNTNLMTSSCTMSLLKRLDARQLEEIRQLVRERLPELYQKKGKHS